MTKYNFSLFTGETELDLQKSSEKLFFIWTYWPALFKDRAAETSCEKNVLPLISWWELPCLRSWWILKRSTLSFLHSPGLARESQFLCLTIESNNNQMHFDLFLTDSVFHLKTRFINLHKTAFYLCRDVLIKEKSWLYLRANFSLQTYGNVARIGGLLLCFNQEKSKSPTTNQFKLTYSYLWSLCTALPV